MDANCSKDVSSSSEFSESFTETDESVYSETSSESGSDSYYSDEYYENNISRDLSAAVDTQNQNNDEWSVDSDSRSSFRYYPNTPRRVDCVSKDSKTHEYFLHLFGEEFLDTVIADTNLYAERKIISKGNLGSSPRFHKWKPTNCEELLAFFGLQLTWN